MIPAPDLSGGDQHNSEDGSGTSEDDDGIPVDLAAALAQTRFLKNLFRQVGLIAMSKL